MHTVRNALNHPLQLSSASPNSALNILFSLSNSSSYFSLLANTDIFQFQFSCSVVSDSLWLHEPQHTRTPCPSPTPRVYPNSWPLSKWCHPTISSSDVPFSSCPQTFPASGSFQMSQLFASGGQSTGVSASTSVLPMNVQNWSPLGWTGWISLQSKGFSRVLSNTTVQNHQFFGAQLDYFFIVQLSHPYMTTGKTIALTRWTFVDKAMCLLFNILTFYQYFNLGSKTLHVPQRWHFRVSYFLILVFDVS